MLGKLARTVFGSANDRFVKRQFKIVQQINALEPEIEKLNNDELKGKTDEFRRRLKEGETLDDILPEAFAVVREAAKRTLGQRHYDVQLIGGIVLHKGMIAEMKTGEGKTLVATLAAYLNAIEGKGVHIVTVNDYLAKRDAEWMGQVYRFLGLTVDYIVHGKNDDERRAAYNADIIYGTNNELGFDYLRDNMKFSREEMVQRDFNYAIVDEVDSILIDEARTPLIISGAAEDSSEKYISVDKIIPHLTDADYEKDEKQKTVTLTEAGMEHVEQLLKQVGLIKEGGLYDIGNVSLVHHVNQALRAHKMHIRDVDYIVKDDKVMIIDEFTGRMMEGRRYSDGLHQAIEAKEHVTIQSENQTLASITFQNYFRLYPKLAGMTGTAMTEEAEFGDIYGLSCVEIPTNRPVQRVDEHDVIYRTEKEKYKAIIDEILAAHEKGQPVLVGTTSIEKSELVAELLRARTKLPFEVLNARHHEREAAIVAQAGVPGAVTIATNMAGRGTDIQLGGNVDMRLKEVLKGDETPEQVEEIKNKLKEKIKEDKEKVLAAGGLYIIGTERHESRRIDNQLRGRSGRQGDPGESRFYLSLQDDLFRLFGGDRMANLADSFAARGLEDAPIELKLVSNSIESAQRKVESRNFAIRKNVLQFDDVINRQRELIYKQRDMVLDGEDLKPTILKMIDETITQAIDLYCPAGNEKADWNPKALHENYQWLVKPEDIEGEIDRDTLQDTLIERAHALYNEREEKFTPEIMRQLERKVLLDNVDARWMEHIDALDELKKGIGLRAYGQQDPVVAFRLESFDMFDEMTASIREGTVRIMLTVPVRSEEDVRREQQAKITSTSGASDGSDKARPVRKDKKPGPNDPCYCGSGKKYKKCHMQADQAEAAKAAAANRGR